MYAIVYFLPILHYLTILPNHRVGSLTIGTGSIEISRAMNRPAAPETHHYKILSAAEHDKYEWLYVEEAQSQSISLMIYYQSPDKEQLYLLSEPQTYPTLEACQKATATLDPESQLFTHWYFETAFQLYSRYPAISTVDSATTAQLANAYQQEMIAAADKAQAPGPHLADLYRAGAGQDILSKLLIDHHLNPAATLTELSEQMQRYHIQLPRVPIHHSASRRPSLSSDTTHIHAPAAPRVNAPH